MSTLEFKVRGSAPEPYTVKFTALEGGKIHATCTCPGAVMGNVCKHRLGLIAGERGATPELAAMLAGSPLLDLAGEILKIEDEMERLKRTGAKLKKAAGAAMAGH
jgi:hypothetical protein